MKFRIGRMERLEFLLRAETSLRTLPFEPE
jgi:hypothetical protein